MKPLALALCFVLLLGGCAGGEIRRKDGSSSARPFSLGNLMKSDVDMVAEITQQEALRHLKLLTEKLYRRNPQAYRKAGLASVEEATARLTSQFGRWAESPLAGSRWEDNFRLAFAEDYPGDRIYAFMSALTVMIMASYEHRHEFFLLDELDPQKLYNSARNIEVALWKLSTARLPNGERFILANSDDGESRNLSFEREFGKLIAQQDLLALVMEDRTNRTITRVLQSAATMAFLPI